MFIIIIRTLLLFLLVMITLRLMGKQQIGQLQPFEFVAALMIAELATIPMENITTPLYTGILPVVTLLTVQTTFGFISLKSNKFRRFISGAPTIIIRDGQILEKAMAKTRYNINDLLEQLRIKNCPNLCDVAFAILETNGELSIILKAEQTAVTLKDIGKSPAPAIYPGVLILDGKLQEDNLSDLNYTKAHLLVELQKFNIHFPEDALIAILDTKGQLFAQKREGSIKCDQ